MMEDILEFIGRYVIKPIISLVRYLVIEIIIEGIIEGVINGIRNYVISGEIGVKDVIGGSVADEREKQNVIQKLNGMTISKVKK